ncbi:ribonuclease H-like domain-containing protein [Tanacetum coccineum]
MGTRLINTVGDANANQPKEIRLEEMDSNCDDLQLHTTSNFKADHVDAYDSDCDDEATTCAIFMASLSPAGSINGDTTEYIEHLVSDNDSYNELTSDINVISYDDYMVTIENDVAQYVPPPEQNNALILYVIEKMQNQVDKCNTINQEAKCVNESLSKTLILAEDSRLKMKDKQKEHDDKPIDYAKLSKLYEYFVPQKQLSAEQVYWSPVSKPTPTVSVFIPKVVEKNDLSKIVTPHLHTNKIIEDCTKVLAIGLLRIESKLINAYFKNNRAVHQDYLNVTKQHVTTLQELLEQATTSNPIDENLINACNFAEHIRDLLVTLYDPASGAWNMDTDGLYASSSRFWDSAHPDYIEDGYSLLLYVDDIVLTASSQALLQQIISSLNQEFSMTDLGLINYFWTPVDTKSKLGIDGDLVSDLTLYQSLASSIMYLTFTRPYISYAVQDACLYMHDPREPHFLALKRIVQSSKRQPTLSCSSVEAEYYGVANAVAETCWLRNLLRELHTPLSSATLDLVADGHVRVLHVPSCYQYTNIFTKGLPSALFEDFRTSLRV